MFNRYVFISGLVMCSFNHSGIDKKKKKICIKICHFIRLILSKRYFFKFRMHGQINGLRFVTFFVSGKKINYQKKNTK